MVPKDGACDVAHTYAWASHPPHFLTPQYFFEGGQAILWMRNLGLKSLCHFSQTTQLVNCEPM